MRKFVISMELEGAKRHTKFFKTLKEYCKHNKAELILLNELTEELKLNNNLTLCPIKLNHNNIDPISGLDGLATVKGNIIVGGPRHRFKTIPRSLKYQKTPTGIWMTGSISLPIGQYKDNKSGLSMRGFHKVGALVVEVQDDEIFHVRQLSCSNTKGRMYDLDKLYYHSGKVETRQIDGLVIGDLHPPFIDKSALNKTLDFISKYTPKYLIYHDIFDAVSISHWLSDKFIDKATNHIKSLKQELELTKEILSKFIYASPKSKHISCESNHNLHLNRYINEFRFKEDYTNLELALNIALQQVKSKYTKINVLEYALSLVYPNYKLPIIFLNEKDTYTVAGNDISSHGHAGANGAKGNPKSFGAAFKSNVVTAHTHSSEIGPLGNYVAGTLTVLSMPYCQDSGMSSWMHSNVIIYADGEKSHYHMV